MLWEQFADYLWFAIDELFVFLGLPTDFSLAYLVFDFLILFIPIFIFSLVIYFLCKLFMWGATLWE